MKNPRKIMSLAVVATLPALLALRPLADEYDLSPRFAVGQRFELRERYSMEMELEQFDVVIDGAPVADEGAVSFELEGEGEVLLIEEVVELRDGAPSRLRFDVTTLEGTMDMNMDAMGESQSMSESLFGDLEGRTLEVTTDEEGVDTVVDVTEDAEPLEEGELESFSHSGHFVELLPTSPLEVGATFDLAAGWQAAIEEAMAELDSSDLDADAARALRDAVELALGAATVVGTGELAAVEGDVATLVYTMKVTITLDDLVERLKSLLPPDALEDLPPGIEARLDTTVEVTGKGSFDLSLGQLTELQLDGTFSMGFRGAAELEGTEASAEVVLTGKFGMEASAAAL